MSAAAAAFAITGIGFPKYQALQNGIANAVPARSLTDFGVDVHGITEIADPPNSCPQTN